MVFFTPSGGTSEARDNSETETWSFRWRNCGAVQREVKREGAKAGVFLSSDEVTPTKHGIAVNRDRVRKHRAKGLFLLRHCEEGIKPDAAVYCYRGLLRYRSQ